MPINQTSPRKWHRTQPNSSWRARSIRPVQVTAFLVIYTNPWARQRKPSTNYCEGAFYFKMDREQYWVNFALIFIFSGQHKLDGAQTRVKKAKQYAANTYLFACAMDQRARLWIGSKRRGPRRWAFLTRLRDVRFTRWLPWRIGAGVTGWDGKLGHDSELLDTVLLDVWTDSSGLDMVPRSQ